MTFGNCEIEVFDLQGNSLAGILNGNVLEFLINNDSDFFRGGRNEGTLKICFSEPYISIKPLFPDFQNYSTRIDKIKIYSSEYDQQMVIENAFVTSIEMTEDSSYEITWLFLSQHLYVQPNNQTTRKFYSKPKLDWRRFGF